MPSAIKQQICALFCALLVMPLVIAETSASLELYDVHTRQQIKNVVTGVTLKGADEESNFDKYILTNVLTFQSDEGTFEIILRIDDLTTEGKDYFLKDKINLQEGSSEKLYLYSVGSLRGTVIDELNNLVSNAELKFECSADYGDTYPLKTDKFGSFSLHYAPAGECRINAYHKNAVGSITVNVEHGKNSDVQIKLEQKTVASNALPYIVGVVIVVAAASWIFLARRKQSTKPMRKKLKTLSHQRTNDIIKTLREKEKTVVNVLLQSNGTSTQAKIKTATGIPKTSLARVLETLRAKNIVEIEILGKLKKVRLTRWFLGTEK